MINVHLGCNVKTTNVLPHTIVAEDAQTLELNVHQEHNAKTMVNVVSGLIANVFHSLVKNENKDFKKICI